MMEQLQFFEKQFALFGQLQPGQLCPRCEMLPITDSIIGKPYCPHCMYDGGIDG